MRPFTAIDSEGNEVVRLEAANLALDALITYPRKFRADGVNRESLTGLLDGAEGLVAGTHTTTSELDAEKDRALGLVATARQAVVDAYVDVEA